MASQPNTLTVNDLKMIIADKEIAIQTLRNQLNEVLQANAALAARMQELDPNAGKAGNEGGKGSKNKAAAKAN